MTRYRIWHRDSGLDFGRSYTLDQARKIVAQWSAVWGAGRYYIRREVAGS